jgi:UDP-N-acetyl-2-amino-2-deoxyglucuronate dehydrogenase
VAIGFGIVGCGMIAKFHARAINEIKGAKLIGCFNHTFEKADAFATEFDCQPFRQLSEMLARDDIQVVTICTPSGAHLEPGLQAAKAGKHLLVEKPLEVTTARCDKLIRACSDAGVQVATIFPSRFHQSSQIMKKAVESNRFGVLTMADAYVKWYRTQQYYDSGAWRGTWKLDGGGALMNQAIHSVDLLLWLMGPVVEVSAFTSTLAHERIEVEDVACANLRFANGALGVIEATTAAFPGSLKRIEIAGSQGQAVMEEENIVKWDFSKTNKQDDKIRSEWGAKTKTGGGASDPAAIGHHGHRELFQEFISSIRSGRQSLSGGIEGRKAVELITAIYKSAQTGKRVKLME